jgi:hypothetical protein
MDSTIPILERCPQKEIILYTNAKPSTKEACDMIRHFCLEHGKHYRKVLQKNSLKYQIDGTMYKVYICMNDPDDSSEGWMICCMSDDSNR